MSASVKPGVLRSMLSLVSETGEKPSAARVKDPGSTPLVRAPQPLGRDESVPLEPLDSAHLVKLANGDMLFHEGEARAGAFRVTSGALCHYMQWRDGRQNLIEMAFPGDIVGFGHLAHHISTARAIIATEVTPVSEAELTQALVTDAELAARMALAADREFDILRDAALASSRGSLSRRVANLVLALATRDASGSIVSGARIENIVDTFFANSLGVPLADLANAVAGLIAGKALAAEEAGLAILDPAALQRAADGT